MRLILIIVLIYLFIKFGLPLIGKLMIMKADADLEKLEAEKARRENEYEQTVQQAVEEVMRQRDEQAKIISQNLANMAKRQKEAESKRGDYSKISLLIKEALLQMTNLLTNHDVEPNDDVHRAYMYILIWITDTFSPAAYEDSLQYLLDMVKQEEWAFVMGGMSLERFCDGYAEMLDRTESKETTEKAVSDELGRIHTKYLDSKANAVIAENQLNERLVQIVVDDYGKKVSALI